MRVTNVDFYKIERKEHNQIGYCNVVLDNTIRIRDVKVVDFGTKKIVQLPNDCTSCYCIRCGGKNKTNHRFCCKCGSGLSCGEPKYRELIEVVDDRFLSYIRREVLDRYAEHLRN